MKRKPEVTSERRVSVAAQEGLQLLSECAAGGASWAGSRFEIVIMRPGAVKRMDGSYDEWRIAAGALRKAGPLFEAVPCYVDHPKPTGSAPSVRNLVGVVSDVAWCEETGGLVGVLRLYDNVDDGPARYLSGLLRQLLADRKEGRAVPPIGLSAVFWERRGRDDAGPVTTRIARVQSVDIVFEAGAGGYVKGLLGAQ